MNDNSFFFHRLARAPFRMIKIVLFSPTCDACCITLKMNITSFHEATMNVASFLVDATA
jgi:hypothetical protein